MSNQAGVKRSKKNILEGDAWHFQIMAELIERGMSSVYSSLIKPSLLLRQTIHKLDIYAEKWVTLLVQMLTGNKEILGSCKMKLEGK